MSSLAALSRPLFRVFEWVREKNRARLARRRRLRERSQPRLPSIYPRAPAPLAPSGAEWEALIAARAGRALGVEPLVDVVVPVYRGLEETLRCVYTVLAATCATPHAVVVIDDASPDPELVKELRRLADAGLLELIHNERNCGFVATCNLGMSLHPGRDVVLLNSDTEVYGDWLDRLRAAALRDPKVGTVTPLSNNATICSYPYFVRDNDMALELELADLDRLAASVNAGQVVEVPTAVGFCMYARRACLLETGAFDVERFGRGYGEENDFCLRSSELGWRHVLACDVFVRHSGSVSFGAEKDARVARALAEIAKRFPDYGERVARFVAADPPLEARRRLDLARMARASRARSGAFLFVTHNWGAGIERHLDDLRRRLAAEDVAVVTLRPDPERPDRAVLAHAEAWPTPNVESFDLRSGVEEPAEILRQLAVRHVHVHSLVGFDQPAAAAWIERLAGALGVAYDFTVHDYVCFCPRINLIDRSGSYCGEPPAAGCERCVRESGSPFGKVAVREWREAYDRLLRGARAVITPAEDVAARVANHFPRVKPAVRRHPEDVSMERWVASAPRAGGERLRVAVLGWIQPHKGLEVLRACARDAARRSLPIEFRLLGHSSDDAGLTRWGNVTVLGKYEDADVQRLLGQERCHCAFIPSIWPETHSYTLSAAILAGLHPVTFDLGAPAERIRALGWGTLIPLATSPGAVNDALLALDSTVTPDPQRLRALFASFDSIVADYYGLRLDLRKSSGL
jgi:GT2 family glycosyltransferase/glycosyltransferase involved in cell wall biosynthesis